MLKNQTIEYYDKNASRYCAATRKVDMSYCRNKFLDYLEQGASILDAGCGSGRDAKKFILLGHPVTAMDASLMMCKEAEKLLEKQVLNMTFQDMTFDNEFDGIWACASLLHVPQKEMNAVISNLRRALKPNGIIYASFKYGIGERLEQGRLFHDFEEEEITKLFRGCRFSVLEVFITQDVCRGREGELWANVLGRKNAG